ncbi:hypothetical protein [Arthrobacter sp. R-11]|uniref:hypothetical protein n=1 Tax=Arthrobacter sp. R-11 TaxID=3404053 RepID=UPI003CF2822D
MSQLNYDLTQFIVKGDCQARLVEQSLRRWQRLAFNHFPEVVRLEQARSGPQVLIPARRNQALSELTAHMKGSMPGMHRFATEAWNLSGEARLTRFEAESAASAATGWRAL